MDTFPDNQLGLSESQLGVSNMGFQADLPSTGLQMTVNEEPDPFTEPASVQGILESVEAPPEPLGDVEEEDDCLFCGGPPYKANAKLVEFKGEWPEFPRHICIICGNSYPEFSRIFTPDEWPILKSHISKKTIRSISIMRLKNGDGSEHLQVRYRKFPTFLL